MKQELSNNKYLYKRLKLEEIKNPQYFFKLWTESNVIKFLIRLFFNKENFIKLFDFRIISSLILRDFYNSKTNKSSILNSFLLIILSIIFYRLSNKTIIEKKHLNLVKIVYARINYFKYKEKQLEGSLEKKKNFIFPNYYLFKFFDLKKKKKFKPRFLYNKNLFENSEWWKIWIIKEILPSWKISSNSIEKINNLLKKKNTNDLKFFFEFYINHLFYQNYDWENNFNFIFFKNLKKNKKFNQNKKVIKNVLILEIFSVFCEKLIFEVKSPLKINKFNSIIKLDKNNNYPLYYKKKVNPDLFYFLKKNVIQNLKFLSEADSIVIKSYIFIKKKKWNFFKNYVEFYVWQLYKNCLFQYETNFNKFTTNKKKLNKKFFKIKNKENTLKKDNHFLEISYHMSKYILYKVKYFNKLTHNYKKVDQKFKLKKTNEIKIKKNFNLINTNSFQSKKNIVLTIWDIFFFNKNEKKKSILFVNPFFKNYLIVWIKNLFLKKQQHIIKNSFFRQNKNTLNSHNSFSNILFIDELKMAFSPNKKYKYKKKFEIIEKQKKKNFNHFLKSDNNKFVFLWKMKKNNQKLNSFLFLDYSLKILSKEKFNNKTKVLMINSNSSTNNFYLIWSLIYKYINIDNYNKNIKYNKILLFQINYFVNLVSFVDKFNLFIIKYNLFNSKKNNCNINYQNNKKNKLKKKLLIIHFFPKFSCKITNNSKLIYNNFSKNLIKSLNNFFLINKFFYNNNKVYLTDKKKIKMNQILLNYNKTKKNQFYYNTIRKNIYIYWKFNKNLVLIDKRNEQKKLLNFFVKKQKNLIVLSNKINFRNNKNLISKWYNKLNKKNSYIFYKTFLLIFSTNFNKISKIFLFYHQNNNILKNYFLKITFNKKNLIKQVKFNIYYKLKTKFNFDKILITKFFINYFSNKKNQSYTKIFNKNFCFSLWQNQEIYFYFLPVSNKNLINSQLFKVNTITLLNSLYYSNLSYKKNLKFYLKKKKKKNLTYIQLIKILPIKLKKKKNLFSNQLTFFSKKKKNLNNKSQIYQFFLFKYFKNFYSKKLLFFHFNKLVNSLIKFNPVFSKKHKNLTNNNLCIQKHLKEYNNINQITFFENKLLSEFFLQIQNENNQIDNWVNKLFIIKSNFTKSLINNSILLNKNNTKINYKKKKFVLSFFLNKNKNNKLILQNKIIKTSNFFIQWNFFKKYTSWLFTFQWWKYFQNLVSNLFLELLLNINDQFNYILFTILENKKIDYLLKNLKFNLKKNLLNNSVEIWNLRLLKQINKHHKNQESELPCFSFNLINKWNKESLTIISLIIFSYFVFQKHFSILLGSEYLELWGYFQIIKYLIDSSRGIYLDNLTKNNSIQLVKSENLLIHFFKNFPHYLKYAKFYLFTNKKITNLLINNKGLDLSRRERKLLVQSLIADKKIDQYRSNLTSNINSFSFQLGDSIIKQHKFKNYLEKLTENYQKNLINYPFNKFYLAENLVFLSFWQKTTSLYVSGQFATLRSTFYKKPVPLELKLFSSKGLLLIGSLETGRSYLVKTIAANSFVPLIKISIHKLLYNKPDIITESWMNILMESLRRLNLILELTEKLSPCIIWMQNIHELNVNRLTQNVESDPTFLLGIFLKYFQTVLKRKYTNSLVIIGSTHLPKKVDPALISPNRLDQLINIRMSNILQRQKKISILLHSQYSNYFYSKNKKSCINEFGYRTMGYNARDLSGLINEILLISIAQNQTIIENKIIRLAFHRQALGSTYINNQINFTQNYGILFYKVGKVIIQNFFLKNFSRNPLYFGNDLWKKKFYYLSKWYLEPSIFESTVKEFTILPHILGCLAGLAARDSWFILENKPDNLISLDKFAENDFYLACGILESFLIEFSWLEILKNKTTNKTKKLNFQFQKKNPLYLIKKGLFSIMNQNKKNKLLNKSVNQTILYKKQFYQLSSNISWAPRIYRLNFIRTNLFNWINRPNDFEITYNLKFLKKKENKKMNVSPEHSHFFEIIQHKTKEQLPYERILSRIRRRNIQELELQLEDILLEEQFVILGFSQLFTEYRMESQLSNKPMIFIGGRFLWDPAGLSFQENNFVFSRQKLFIDEEMLRRLYVTYGARREREKSRSSQKIKQFFLRRGYGRDSINDFSINWWNQLPFIEKNNIETFKRIEGIGVQLKRPQVFTPVYLYQRWLIENPRENLTRFSFLNNQQRWLKVNNLLLNDSFIYNTLLEIYQYLLNFFISHQILLNQMTKLLLKKKWLFHDDIKYFINMFKKIN
uniref:Protein Ycf2 n=1 Tax=Pseudocrossidium replicatum TaxID=885028 RepID=A0A4P9CW17_9BRYO|nr:putative chloroplast RF2 [Pseudocrossidium replicatum]QCT81826.1 putative chloroplast RF2 [Pseudocrossidium replicatum]